MLEVWIDFRDWKRTKTEIWDGFNRAQGQLSTMMSAVGTKERAGPTGSG